jgi:hypothetical protein
MENFVEHKDNSKEDSEAYNSHVLDRRASCGQRRRAKESSKKSHSQKCMNIFCIDYRNLQYDEDEQSGNVDRRSANQWQLRQWTEYQWPYTVSNDI